MQTLPTTPAEAVAQHPQRRHYSPELKAQVIAQCQLKGVSVASVALAHGINAGIVRRWLRAPLTHSRHAVGNEFVALPLPSAAPPMAASGSAPLALALEIRVEVRRKAAVVTVSWPVQDAASCASWLREWLR